MRISCRASPCSGCGAAQPSTAGLQPRIERRGCLTAGRTVGEHCCSPGHVPPSLGWPLFGRLRDARQAAVVPGKGQVDPAPGEAQGLRQVGQAAAGVGLRVIRRLPRLKVERHNLKQALGTGTGSGARVPARLDLHDRGNQCRGKCVRLRPCLNVLRPALDLRGEHSRQVADGIVRQALCRRKPICRKARAQPGLDADGNHRTCCRKDQRNQARQAYGRGMPPEGSLQARGASCRVRDRGDQGRPRSEVWM
jgi:hypothetical protein